MRTHSEITSDGTVETLFSVGDVPGVLWRPGDHAGGRSLVLMAHGGGQHKKAPPMLGRARRLLECGFAVCAIDAPGHGERPRTASDAEFGGQVQRAIAAGQPLGPIFASYNIEMARRAVPEWHATLDALMQATVAGHYGPIGF